MRSFGAESSDVGKEMLYSSTQYTVHEQVPLNFDSNLGIWQVIIQHGRWIRLSVCRVDHGLMIDVRWIKVPGHDWKIILLAPENPQGS